MKPYISIDELKYDIQQQAENLPDYIMKDYSPGKINLQKAVELYYSSKRLFDALPPKELFRSLNDAMIESLKESEDNKDEFESSARYITSQIWNLTQISNFIACAIPD